MDFIDPYDITVPPGTRRIGEAPFWEPGDTVIWMFRRFDFERDHAEVRRPMRVIEDGPEGTVLWLAGGTPTMDTRIVGWEGTNPHDVPLKVRFRPLAEAPRRVMVPGTWRGAGVLKIVPANVPFSVWVLLKFAEGADSSDGAGVPGLRVEWYVNMEAEHRRAGAELFTSDHILDITFPLVAGSRPRADVRIDPAGAVFKDVDELAAAANYGMWPPEWSDIIRRNGMTVLENLGAFGWAIDPEREELARRLAAGESQRIKDGCYDRDWI